jgi:hypothetical protein
LDQVTNKFYTKICQYCSVPFETNYAKQIFCSKKCTRNSSRLKNKDKIAQKEKEFRLKNIIVPCSWCFNPLSSERRKGRFHYCSEKCRKAKISSDKKKEFRKNQKAFLEFKVKIGCKNCGYNKNGACLDFHHLEKYEKERYISCALWVHQSELFFKEFNKCVLLCKNCHHELHSKELNN